MYIPVLCSMGWFLKLQNLSSMQQLCSCLYGSNMNTLVRKYKIESNVTYEIKEGCTEVLM
jgi:hypothetical protein